MCLQGTAPLADDLATLGAVEEAHFAERDTDAAAALDAALAPGGERDTATAGFFVSVAGEDVHGTGGSAGSSLETVPGFHAMVAEHYAAVRRHHLEGVVRALLVFATNSQLRAQR